MSTGSRRRNYRTPRPALCTTTSVLRLDSSLRLLFQICLNEKCGDSAGSVDRKAGMARRRFNGLSSSPMRIAETVPECTDAVDERHGAPKDCLDGLLRVLIGGEIQ